MTGDVFGTVALRHAVTEAWLGSGTRFREDANAEEDHARGYYRDRVVVELAQNAQDAAARAGVPGRLRLRLTDLPAGDPRGVATLVAANTGAPLTADGVASLASLRASAKTAPGADDGPDGGAPAAQVGRFGVGFAAVRAVADEVTVRSRGGGVRFSLAATRDLLADVAPAGTALRDAVAGRGDDLPVLRLPFPAPALGEDAADDDEAYDTLVELVLRDAAAVDAVRAQLDALDDALLLALPALASVTIDRCERVIGPVADSERGQTSAHSDDGGTASRVLADLEDRWVVLRRSGAVDEDAVADLPREQRRSRWSVAWAVRRDGGTVRGGAAEGGVLHAPTPTDVPLTFPALLVASFPVDPGRRRVLPGALTDRVATEAGRAYADLLAGLATERGADVLELVPGGMPAGDLDAAVRDAALDALRSAPLLPAPRGTEEPSDDAMAAGAVAPADATVLVGAAGDDPGLVAVLAGVVPGLVALTTAQQGVARRLGATPTTLADVVADLPGGLPPARWHAVCAALELYASDPGLLEALAGARVPLADGRTASGVRGTVVLPEDDDDPALAAVARTLGVRVVHPDAAHPLLVRAGATSTSPRALLDDPGVRALALAASEALLDGAADVPQAPGVGGPTLVGPVDVSPREVVQNVLALARLALAGGGDAFPFWLGELPVPTEDGMRPAREAVLPGSWAAGMPGLAPVTRAALAYYTPPLLTAVGVRAGVGVYRVADVLTPDPADPEPEHGPDDPAGWLSGWEDYLRYLADRVGPGVDVGDVDAVADLDAVDVPSDEDDDQADGDPWAGVLAALVADPDARRALVTPVAGAPSYTAWWLRDRLGAPFAAHDGVPLLPPPPPAVAALDPEARRALGVVDGLDRLDPLDWPAALDRLPEPGTSVPLPVALGVWRGLAGLAVRLAPGARASALDPLPDRLPALDASDVVVRLADDVEVAGTARWAVLGAVLPVPEAEVAAVADLLDLPVVGEDGLPSPDGPGVERALDERVAALDPRLPRAWFEHGRLSVAGGPVPWWVDAEGRAHATDRAGLAAALADLLGRPDRAALLATVLAAPERAAELWVTTAWG
ncbi:MULTISPECIES: sacsin N-terminal ATP-binding-like domain-containing protein [unclassified Isoptericola]|uniref:sacsin N-terminal ATP-binding-like domain-containing protein n=1 Tax=unclassified Isoptericola TaxID=2623355 RepID=UPI003654F19F